MTDADRLYTDADIYVLKPVNKVPGDAGFLYVIIAGEA